VRESYPSAQLMGASADAMSAPEECLPVKTKPTIRPSLKGTPLGL
jgi:hypothetical protein